MSASIAIIGTGFGGLGMAIRLKQKGIEDFIIFERAGDVGGTWRDNTYPGCACDVESNLYSFSFASNPKWTRRFAPQAEIWEYLRQCTEQYGIRGHIRFNHEVKDAAWDDGRKLWTITTSQGTYTARALITATGPLSEPLIPRIPGLDRFAGKVMHSARWDHGFDLRGRRVAAIGTGASAIQYIPAIQPLAGRLHVFQRTPAWVIPRPDRAVTDFERRLYSRFPILQKLSRWQIFLLRELTGYAFRFPRLMNVLRLVAVRHLRKTIRDPGLRKKLTPRYTIGCKRILLSNDYYPALLRDNIEVVTDPIREIRKNSIVTENGVEREVDVIILGTGFRTTDMPFAEYIRGRGGRLLSDLWQGSPKAYLGTTVAGFPNLFMLLGPNTGLGHSSVVLMIESQIEHVIKALGHMRRHSASAIEPRVDAQSAFNSEIEKKTAGTVWVTGGCSSWYLDRTGRNSTIWPRSIPSFRRRAARFEPRAFSVEPAQETT